MTQKEKARHEQQIAGREIRRDRAQFFVSQAKKIAKLHHTYNIVTDFIKVHGLDYDTGNAFRALVTQIKREQAETAESKRTI